jgi:Tetracyclin repressor-like, C-terminal domain
MPHDARSSCFRSVSPGAVRQQAAPPCKIALAARLRSGRLLGLDAGDLPAYAARLFDSHCDQPDLLRLVTWARLEGCTTPSAQEQRRASYRRRTAAIEDAQRAGTITSALTGSQLLDLIESLAVGWTAAARGVLATPRQLKAERAAQRQAITEAVCRIIEPG